MPLIFRAAVAWAAGTALGLSFDLPPSASLAGAALALALLVTARPRGAAVVPREPPSAGRGRDTASAAALLLVACAGAELGAQLRAADARCRHAATTATRWRARLAAPASPGAFVRATLDAPGCQVPLWIAVRSGRADAGSLVEVVRGERAAGGSGLMLREAHLEVRRAPGPLDRWRARTAEALDRRFGADGPLVRALLIADTRGLAPSLRERYADAGLVHILSISGLHVAIVGGALLLAFEALRLGRAGAGAAALAVTWLYVLAIGAPPPAVRSATLFSASQLTRFLQRPVSPWATFALGALVPLVEPRTVLDLGWQLSVSGYAAIVVAGRFGRRRLPEAWGRRRRALARELVAGVLTTAATAPLVAWHFGRLSLVSPLSNIAAGPIVALLQPALFLAMLVPAVPGGAPVADFVADAARPLLRALDAVATTAAALPGASVAVAPTLAAVALAALAVGAILVAAWTRHWRAPATVAASALALLAWGGEAPVPGDGRFEVHLLDVGQGDAIALRTPRGRWILVDAGRQWASGDAGRATVIPQLRRRGGPLTLLVLSHPHADHIGGAASVVRALRPREVRDAAFVQGSATYRDLLAEVAARGGRWARVRPGERIALDGVELEFLAPDSAWTASLRDPNEASTVVRVRHGAVRLLLTGDAERAEEAWLLAHAREALAAEILKVAHHGSRTSTTAALVEAVAPRLALVSVGAGNLYGHPSAEVMERLADAGATILRTDQLGTVIIRSDGRALEVEAMGVRWPVARPLPVTP